MSQVKLLYIPHARTAALKEPIEGKRPGYVCTISTQQLTELTAEPRVTNHRAVAWGWQYWTLRSNCNY